MLHWAAVNVWYWEKKHSITELRENRWGWKGPLETLQAPLQSGITRSRFAQGCVQQGFEYHQGWGVHNFSGQPVPVSDQPYSKKSLFFLFYKLSIGKISSCRTVRIVRIFFRPPSSQQNGSSPNWSVTKGHQDVLWWCPLHKTVVK